MGLGRGSEIANSGLDVESEVAGVHLGGSSQSCKYGFGAYQGGLGCESSQGCLQEVKTGRSRGRAMGTDQVERKPTR